MDDRRSSKFGLGLLLGAVGGALAGIFLSPKSGKAMRKDAKKKYDELMKLMKDKEVDKKVKAIFGNVTAESKKLYEQVKEELISRLAQMKKDIDKNTYVKQVENVVDSLKSPLSKQSVSAAKKLKDSLSKDWTKLEKSLKKPN